jgi:serine phosphatase RsbU (regulator of sigma subunit)
MNDASATITEAPHTMQCMEIWGGNEPFDAAVAMSGLDAWVYCRPYKEAAGGGDIYYVSSCATGRITRLLVADVSGHGVSACDPAGSLRSLMRQYVNFIDQTAFVREMNRRFAADAKAGCFATAIVTTFFAPTGELSLCNAGHPPPFIYRARTGEWEVLEKEVRDRNANVPLGLLDLTEYEQFEATLEAGDLVMCYTDSCIESNGPDGQMLGVNGLLGLLRGMNRTEPAQLIREVLGAINAQREGNLKDDDVTVLVFRANGLGRTVSLKNKLLAPARVLGGVFRSIKNGERAPWPQLSVKNVGGAIIGALGGGRRG